MTAFDPRWQQVTCCSCGRSYQCTPEADYYGGDSATTGVCFACLLIEGGLDPEVTPVQVINLNGTGNDPRDLSRRPGDAP